MYRNQQLQIIQNQPNWDLIIIGGGANGLGVAVDAASRGLKTLLLEAVDFAKGTSSRSTKLAHGGVRYLEQGNFALVIEALRERGLMEKNAAHLVKNESFIIPNYNYWGGLFYTFGLKLYDLLSGKRSLGSSKYLSRKTAIKLLPGLNPQGLKSGVLYHDGQFDDARLAINLAQTAIEKGACLINHFKVTQLLKSDKKQITAIVAIDQLSNQQYSIQGKAIINATGVFTNAIMKMNDSVYKKLIVPSQGVHLVFDKSFLVGDHALMIPKTSDGRVLFAIPWHDKIVIGTTDTMVKKSKMEPIALEEEIEFILTTAQNYLAKKPTRADVLAVFAGLRPLAAPEKKGQPTKEVSRSHKIIVSKTGLISITGGKWTTYRQIAEEIVDRAIAIHKLQPLPCITKDLPIHGNKQNSTADFKNPLYFYGTDSPAITHLQEKDSFLKEKLHPAYNYTMAEVYWAIHKEMAMTVEDVLARRVRLLFLDARAAISCAEKVALFMAKELHYDQNWIQNQLTDFKTIANGFLLKEYRVK